MADISEVLAKVGHNITAMDVEKTDDLADIYLEVEYRSGMQNKRGFLELLKNIPGLKLLRFVDALPRERREKAFRIVLDNISDGVISIDVEGRITTINRVAREMLNCRDQEVEGEKITTLESSKVPILGCLKGKTYFNEKRTFITDNGRFGFLAAGRPIIDSRGRIVGAVEILKDMKEIRDLAREVSQPAKATFSDIIGKSPAIKEAVSFAQKIAPMDTVVAIRGESGTGKELLARAIHEESGRPGPFVPINCAALPENLLESELFGYVGGAFTGAHKKGAPGLFETASNGTIFLDEIAELPLGPQAKLLRVIQEKSVRRLGGKKEIPVKARIITATNRSLEEMVKEKTFRQDLYYRISVLPIHIPPLNERLEDIPVLVEHILFQLAARLNEPVQSIRSRAMAKLQSHVWPGNVRELKNVVERAAILCDGTIIDENLIIFSFELGNRRSNTTIRPVAETNEALLADRIASYEKQIIKDTLENARSIRQAAGFLGISHTALLNKMKKYGLKLAR